MKLFKTQTQIVLQDDELFFLIESDWDILINRDKLFNHLLALANRSTKLSTDNAQKILQSEVVAPIGTQEVWAAGVTYSRSRDARMEESKKAGAADLYDRVYEAERPELFFKALPHRVSGPNQNVYIRRDSSWNVPEPELTLFINSNGNVEGYTIGNDMSSRSIEGENPLYLPQAKMYEKSAALGPCLYVPESRIPSDTVIHVAINRNNETIFSDSVRISRIKRSFDELAGYLFRECEFSSGCFLMTGTSLVPPGDFTLKENDTVSITIDGIGTLTNKVICNPGKFPVR
jgi:2-dehydro-3-deoxy-D-arabinonate dehydratase